MGFWKNAFKRRINLDIISGGQFLNEHAIPVKVAVLVEGDQRGEVFTQIGLTKTPWKIDGIEWEESSTRSAGKAAGGAIVGTLVAGPLGTIAGAAIGGRKRDNSKAFVYLINPETNEEVALHIRCSESQYREIASL